MQSKRGRAGGMALGSLIPRWPHTQTHSSPSTYLLRHPPSLHDPPFPAYLLHRPHARLHDLTLGKRQRRALHQVGLALHPPGGGAGRNRVLVRHTLLPVREGKGAVTGLLCVIPYWHPHGDRQGWTAKASGGKSLPPDCRGEIPPPRNSLVEEVLVCACSHGLQGAEREGRGMRLAQR